MGFWWGRKGDKYIYIFFSEVVPNRSKEILLQLITKHILPGTTNLSDCWKSYDYLSDNIYVHLTANHSITFKRGRIQIQLRGYEEGVIKQEFWRHGHSRRSNPFDSYFAEFRWRWKYKSNMRELFPSFLSSIKQIFPAPGRDTPVSDKD